MEYLSVERKDATCVIYLDNPPVNSIHLELLLEAEGAISELEGDDECRALVMTGRGGCFSAGLDLKVVPRYDAQEQHRMIEAINRVVKAVYSFSKPTVAAVNGPALAGGFIMLVCCDYRLGIDGSYPLGLTEARVGVPFPVATMEALKNELAPAVLRRLLLTGSHVDPSWALDWRILDELLPRRQLMPRALDVAADLGSVAPGAYRVIKNQLRGDTVARIEETMASDPMFKGWMTSDTIAAADDILGLSEG